MVAVLVGYSSSKGGGYGYYQFAITYDLFAIPYGLLVFTLYLLIIT